jgi:hypothetical protein
MMRSTLDGQMSICVTVKDWVAFYLLDIYC